MLIRAYGQYWNPDIVDWGTRGAGNKGTLPGRGDWGQRRIDIDSWDQHGIYVLHDEFKCVYVGQTANQFLGKRLRDHLTDRFAGRWNMFSWYGVDSIRKGGTLRPAGTRQVAPTTLIATIEAMGILIADPPLNRRRETLERAILIEQKKSSRPHTVRHYLEELLSVSKDIQTKVRISQ
jgi:hypothetical protein